MGPWRMPGVGRDALPWDGDTKREKEFAGVPGENKSAKGECKLGKEQPVERRIPCLHNGARATEWGLC